MKIFRKISVLMLFFTLFMANFAFFEPMVQKTFAAAKEWETSAKAMAVIEKASGRMLMSKNADERLPMASTTKIITAIYVLSICDDLDSPHEIPKEAVGIEGTSIGLKEGEHLSVRELLYGLMLRSGNDAAVALAIITGGSEKEFVRGANEFITSLGLSDTHLVNPHGLPAEGHYTSASDLAKITAYALKNATFAEIVSTKERSIPNELHSSFSRDLKNKNKMLSSFEFADGVKTGYTRRAGRCFVGSATKDGMQVICVLLNCVPMFEDCERLLRSALDEYKLYKLVSEGDKLATVALSGSRLKSVDAFAGSDFYYPLRRNELALVKLSVTPSEGVSAPLRVGDNLGSIEIYLENQLIFSDKIYTIKDVEANDTASNFNKIIEKMQWKKSG